MLRDTMAAASGLGVLIITRSLHPARPMLAVAPRQLAEPRAAVTGHRHDGSRSLAAGARALGLQRLISPSVSTDLRLLGRSPGPLPARRADQRPDRSSRSRHPGVGGINTAVELPVPLLLALASAGVLLPNLTILSEAAKRRRSFNHSLSAFLDLVAVNLAAGRGIEGALDTAAHAGNAWAFGKIRRALYRAKVNPSKPLTSQNRRTGCSQAISC